MLTWPQGEMVTQGQDTILIPIWTNEPCINTLSDSGGFLYPLCWLFRG